MKMEQNCRRNAAWLTAIVAMTYVLIGTIMTTGSASAQVRYTYLPSPSVTDGRFFSIAGEGIQSLGQTPMNFKITSPASHATLELGIFDGETGGTWDQGSVPLLYTLYADPNGDATGTTMLGQWVGTSMPDNAWFTATVDNSPAARTACGDFAYVLRVGKQGNANGMFWSSFKVRSSGTLAIARSNSFAYTAPLASILDAQIIYPAYPGLGSTTYDGTWRFYIDVANPGSSLTLWDGDMDRGSYDCSDNDTDDPDTPNGVIPSFAVGTDAVAEGVAVGGVNCTNAIGVQVPGKTTSNPPDDSRNAAFRRGNKVSYRLITPAGDTLRNINPSGNLEWEQFTLSTAAFNAATMDHHVNTLPSGIYKLEIEGVDLSNLNAWRFPFEAVGVDSNGTPVIPACGFNDGTVEGTVFVDANNNHIHDPGEAGIPNVRIFWLADYDNNGVIDDSTALMTDMNGKYKVTDLRAGKYTARIDLTTIPPGLTPSFDTDGVGTPNVASTIITAGDKNKTLSFAYQAACAPGTGTRGYWQNHPEAWPVASLMLGDSTYTKAQAISILGTPVRGDKTYSMAAQLIAAKLNLLRGNDGSCICATVNSADAWLKLHPVGSGIGSGSQAWGVGSPLHALLDDYNNGLLCAQHRDEVSCPGDQQNEPKDNNRRKNRNDRHDDEDEDDGKKGKVK